MNQPNENNCLSDHLPSGSGSRPASDTEMGAANCDDAGGKTARHQQQPFDNNNCIFLQQHDMGMTDPLHLTGGDALAYSYGGAEREAGLEAVGGVAERLGHRLDPSSAAHGSNHDWDINDPDIPTKVHIYVSRGLDAWPEWADGHCRHIFPADMDEAKRHSSGWAMRNTNNHNVNILKKSCLGVLLCSARCRLPSGKLVTIRPAICDKARRKQQGKPCPAPGCNGVLEIQACRGHCGYPVTHFWRHISNIAIFFQAKGYHDHPKPESKTPSELRRVTAYKRKLSERKQLQQQQRQQRAAAARLRYTKTGCPPSGGTNAADTMAAARAAKLATAAAAAAIGQDEDLKKGLDPLKSRQFGDMSDGFFRSADPAEMGMRVQGQVAGHYHAGHPQHSQTVLNSSSASSGIDVSLDMITDDQHQMYKCPGMCGGISGTCFCSPRSSYLSSSSGLYSASSMDSGYWGGPDGAIGPGAGGSNQMGSPPASSSSPGANSHTPYYQQQFQQQQHHHHQPYSLQQHHQHVSPGSWGQFNNALTTGRELVASSEVEVGCISSSGSGLTYEDLTAANYIREFEEAYRGFPSYHSQHHQMHQPTAAHAFPAGSHGDQQFVSPSEFLPPTASATMEGGGCQFYSGAGADIDGGWSEMDQPMVTGVPQISSSHVGTQQSYGVVKGEIELDCLGPAAASSSVYTGTTGSMGPMGYNMTTGGTSALSGVSMTDPNACAAQMDNNSFQDFFQASEIFQLDSPFSGGQPDLSIGFSDPQGGQPTNKAAGSGDRPNNNNHDNQHYFDKVNPSCFGGQKPFNYIVTKANKSDEASKFYLAKEHSNVNYDLSPNNKLAAAPSSAAQICATNPPPALLQKSFHSAAAKATYSHLPQPPKLVGGDSRKVAAMTACHGVQLAASAVTTQAGGGGEISYLTKQDPMTKSTWQSKPPHHLMDNKMSSGRHGDLLVVAQDSREKLQPQMTNPKTDKNVADIYSAVH